MPSPFETCYPVLKSQLSMKELIALYSPSDDEIDFANSLTRNRLNQLGFLIQMKTFQRLGYSVDIEHVPPQIQEHVAQVADLSRYLERLPTYMASSSKRRHLSVIREFLHIRSFDIQAHHLLVSTMDEAAQTKQDLTDIINIAIEQLVEQRYELPSFNRLVNIARQARQRHNEHLFKQVSNALTPKQRTRLNGLFTTQQHRVTSDWNRLKEEPGPPTLERLQDWTTRLSWLQSLQFGASILEQIPAAKIAHFANEASTLDLPKMKELKANKRYTLALSLLVIKHAQVLDDLAEYFIKRIRKLHARGRDALDEYRRQTQGKTDELIVKLRELVLAFQSEKTDKERIKAIHKVVGQESDQLVQDCNRHLAYFGNNYLPFLNTLFHSSRPTIFRLLEVLPIASSTRDKTMEECIAFIKRFRWHRENWIEISESQPVPPLDWLPRKWRPLVTGQTTKRQKLKRIHKRSFEVCVVSNLSLGLQAGDLHIPGSDQFDDYYKQLISWEEYHASIKEFGEMLDIPIEGKAFINKLKEDLKMASQQTDAGFPSNPHVSLKNNRIILHKKRIPIPEDLKALESAIKRRMSSVNILDILTDTQRWVPWTNNFGPISGHEAKIENPTARYLLTIFCYGCNIGPSQLSKAFKNLDRKQLSWVHHRHIQDHTLQKAIEGVINFYYRFSLPQFWGSGKHASVDGTKWNIQEQNLLAEYHIRYGGYGGIGYYHVSDNYIALFSHFIPCGVWEAIYILDGLLENKSDIQPDTIHGDTQAQSATVFALSYLLGIKLMPRIRGWQNLTFYKPAGNSRLKHLDILFNQVAPWKMIETYLPDMFRVALSVKTGKIQASTLFRKLGTNSSSNKLFQAFQALGGVLRTIYLLQYIDDVDMRNMVHGSTNKSESFNHLAKWLAFGGETQVFASNDREELRKRVKYNQLVANCLILHNMCEISCILNELASEGQKFSRKAIAALSPYLTAHINRFGLYSLDEARQLAKLYFDINPNLLIQDESASETDFEWGNA